MGRARSAQLALQDFVADADTPPRFVSLGETCISAWYLKEVGLRQAAYPFDWVFSSPEMVIDCIDDGFERLLDKSCIEPRSEDSAGHRYYHSSFFNHRNPLASAADYGYYERCCRRFLADLESPTPMCCMITLINEPAKRPGWARGFDRHFRMPVDHDHESVVPLFKRLKERNPKARLIVVEHYTDSDGEIAAERVDADFMVLRFNALGASNGVRYLNQLDDARFKQVLSGLHRRAG